MKKGALEQYRAMYDKPKLVKENPQLFPPPNPNTKHYRPRGIGVGKGFLPRYQTVDALEFAIDLYFKQKEDTKTPPTLPGLALALGFSSTKTLRTYEDKGDDYATTIVTARTRVEEYKNELLLKGGPATQGVIFDLKNHHEYSDKIEQKNTHSAEGSLAELLVSLQGCVHRPTLQPIPVEIQTEYAEFEELTTPQLDDLLR